MSTFTGFSEEDLKRIKFSETVQDKGRKPTNRNAPKVTALTKVKRLHQSEIGNNMFTSIKKDEINAKEAFIDKKETKAAIIDKEKAAEAVTVNAEYKIKNVEHEKAETTVNEENKIKNVEHDTKAVNGVDVTPDVVKGVDGTEDEMAPHKAKLEELQLKQKLMEEQNKKRKEMLSKALADRTRQTEEEVMKLEKIKKELQVLDGQFSQDVAVLRKKIDAACLTYSEAEKHYLRVEKEFLQAKIQLQKEKEKKELLTEHLCALITHNETRKAQKLETLMLELANNKKLDIPEPKVHEKDDTPIIMDGVDQRTGKMVEFNGDS